MRSLIAVQIMLSEPLFKACSELSGGHLDGFAMNLALTPLANTDSFDRCSAELNGKLKTVLRFEDAD